MQMKIKSQISNTYEGPVNVGNKKQQGLEEPVNCQRVQLTYDIYEESDCNDKLIATNRNILFIAYLKNRRSLIVRKKQKI